MSRYAFVALAVALGVVVNGMPQHRFQPNYQVSLATGKTTEGASVGVDGAGSTDPLIPAAEFSPIIQEVVPNVAQVMSPELEFHNLWKKAAMNLVNVPHLLQWVSSLQPDVLTAAIADKKEVVPEYPQQQQEVVTEIVPEIINEPEYADIVTEAQELYTTTDMPTPVEIISEPEPIQISQPEIVEVQPEQLEIIDYQPEQPEVILTQPEEQEVVEVQPELIQQQTFVDQQQEQVVFVQPEAESEVVYDEPSPVEETVQPQINEEVTYIQEQPMEEAIAVQPETIQEEIYVQPEPIQEEIYVQPEITQEEIYVQPEPIQEEIYVQSEPIQEEIFVESEPIQEEIFVQSEPIQEEIFVESEPIQEEIFVESEPIQEEIFVQSEPIQEEIFVESEPIQEEIFVQSEPIQEEIYVEPKPVKQSAWEPKQAYEKVSLQQNKKRISKFKYNRFDNPKQSLNRGKTLLSHFPAPEPSPFSLDSFVFPAYSYSISHQPSQVYYKR